MPGHAWRSLWLSERCCTLPCTPRACSCRCIGLQPRCSSISALLAPLLPPPPPRLIERLDGRAGSGGGVDDTRARVTLALVVRALLAAPSHASDVLVLLPRPLAAPQPPSRAPRADHAATAASRPGSAALSADVAAIMMPESSWCSFWLSERCCTLPCTPRACSCRCVGLRPPRSSLLALLAPSLPPPPPPHRGSWRHRWCRRRDDLVSRHGAHAALARAPLLSHSHVSRVLMLLHWPLAAPQPSRRALRAAQPAVAASRRGPPRLCLRVLR